MNKIIRTAACSAVLALPAFAANVITDPGFELTVAGQLPDSGGTSQWSSFTETANNTIIQSTIFHTGTQALAIDAANGSGFAIVYQNTGSSLTTAMIENTTWNWSFWVYTLGTGVDSFNYEFMPSNSLNENQPGASGTIAANILVPGTWTRFSGSFSTGDFALNPTLMKANFLSLPGAGTATFYIDDVELSAVPEPGSALLSTSAALGLLVRRRGASRAA